MRKIGIIILLVLCLTVLLLTGCIINTVTPETTSGNLGNQENTEEPVTENTEDPVTENTEEPVTKWSGLGMNVCAYFATDEEHDGWIDMLLANGFTEIRETPVSYQDTSALAKAKAATIRAIAKGANIIWGVSSNSYDNPDYIITAENWSTFRQAILDAAQWAQDNGVYEFQLGNEEEFHVDGDTMTVAQIITNLKSVATEVQEIFTNGNVSYSCTHDYISNWITAGKGDMDILASNVYFGGDGYYDDSWKTKITNLVNAFGVDGTCLTEFNLSWSSLNDYSTDEAVQAKAISEMINYIKASGMTRAFYFLWYLPTLQMGVVKDDDTYRLLWNQALLNTGPVKFVTVPTKTTTASLPNTIALIPNPDSTSTLASGSSVKSTL